MAKIQSAIDKFKNLSTIESTMENGNGVKLSRKDIEALCSMYPVDQIFVQDAVLYIRERTIKVRCSVPKGAPYATRPAPYVTKEQQIRCVSQSGYALVGGLLEERDHVIDPRLFRGRIESSTGLFYRREDLKYKNNIPADEPFSFVLSLDEIAQKGPFLVGNFTLDGPTKGTLQFIAK